MLFPRFGAELTRLLEYYLRLWRPSSLAMSELFRISNKGE